LGHKYLSLFLANCREGENGKLTKKDGSQHRPFLFHIKTFRLHLIHIDFRAFKTFSGKSSHFLDNQTPKKTLDVDLRAAPVPVHPDPIEGPPPPQSPMGVHRGGAHRALQALRQDRQHQVQRRGQSQPGLR
jgi:hypothetical protein